MTNLINQITINGEVTTFFNYVNSVVSAEPARLNTDGNIYNFSTFFNTAWGANKASLSPVSAAYLLPPGDPYFTGNISSTNRRFHYTAWGGQLSTFQGQICSTATPSSTLVQSSQSQFFISGAEFTFAVANSFGYCFASFADIGRTTITLLHYRSWLKNGVYTGAQRPRNLVGLDMKDGLVRDFFRVQTEDTTNRQGLNQSNPSLSCAIATPGANSTEILAVDNTSPNNYIGELWNMIRMPSSCVVGKIYKNTGVDPDTGNIETDQKRFWMCVGSWGTDKIGMRVWTEDIA